MQLAVPQLLVVRVVHDFVDVSIGLIRGGLDKMFVRVDILRVDVDDFAVRDHRRGIILLSICCRADFHLGFGGSVTCGLRALAGGNRAC
jgi:hypothetical protein